MKKLISLFFVFSTALSVFSGVGESSFDHSIWDQLLAKNVNSVGNVNYEGFATDKEKLTSYLTALSKNSPAESWSKNEKMAFWINAYNAFTVKLILDNMPIKSIMKINGGKAWDLKFIEIGGKTLSLNNIEHDILRAKYKDARIHFAVNCASISCPKIKNAAFTATDLDAQLTKMSISFVNNSSKNTITADKIQISNLFEWYKDDFTKEGTIIEFLNKYSKTKINSKAKISFKEYDWGLNS
jgi:hypothetical protein